MIYCKNPCKNAYLPHIFSQFRCEETGVVISASNGTGQSGRYSISSMALYHIPEGYQGKNKNLYYVFRFFFTRAINDVPTLIDTKKNFLF